MKTFTTYTMMDELMASPTQPIDGHRRLHQLTRMWEGLAAMESAENPTPDDWRVVSDAVNLRETLIAEGVAMDPAGLLQDATAGMTRAGRRMPDDGKIRLDGEGMKAVRAILEDYADLLEVLPARIVIRAHRKTEKRIQEILHRKRQSHDVVIV
ncbi:MAG: hypothetical protein RJA36_913 [Pseudomonadota bacterium]|jgi:hypothetical protein